MKKIFLVSITTIAGILVAWNAVFYFSEPDEKYLNYKIDPNVFPIQKDYEKNVDIWLDDVKLEAVADYEIRAVVLSKERYYLDKMSSLVPVDLALGWGRMSDPLIYDQLKITQGGRWYKWRTKTNFFPIPKREIEKSSANVHIVPANEEIRKNILKLKKGYKVALKGKLINIYMPDGTYYLTSRTREDVAGGSCEILYVEDFQFSWE